MTNTQIELGSVGYYRWPKYSSLRNVRGDKNMYSTVRVLLLLTGVFVLPATLIILPLHLKYKVFGDIQFLVTESDVLEITDGISSIFCEAHTLKMNSSFNAFQINNSQMDTNNKKHFRLHKSMTLPDDSLEYWGFFLNKGSVVNLSLCSRYSGGRIMVVKDIKDFHTCGLTDPKPKQNVDQRAKKNNEVFIFYETNAEIMPQNSNEFEGEDISEETVRDVYEKLKKKPKNPKSREVSPSTTAATTTSNRRIVRSIEKITRREGFLHGKTNESESSQSSFEQSLVSCHNGRILLNENFPTSPLCTNLKYLENRTRNMQLQHDVHADGYYFYIFYSDNDERNNEIHAIFDIFKPTYEYTQHVRGCVNKTECTFPISFLSDDRVVVEIPMRDGIEHETDDVTSLVSTCQPRKLVYAAFTVAVLILILLFAFM